MYLQAVVDTSGSSGFAFRHTSKSPKCAVANLRNDVLLPRAADFRRVILTYNGRAYCGTEAHLPMFMALNYLSTPAADPPVCGPLSARALGQVLPHCSPDDALRTSHRPTAAGAM